jgi:hypothetical protein
MVFPSFAESDPGRTLTELQLTVASARGAQLPHVIIQFLLYSLQSKPGSVRR